MIFFGRIARRVGGLVRRAAPVLKNVAPVAVPAVGVVTVVVLARQYLRSGPEETGADKTGLGNSEPKPS